MKLGSDTGVRAIAMRCRDSLVCFNYPVVSESLETIVIVAKGRVFCAHT